LKSWEHSTLATWDSDLKHRFAAAKDPKGKKMVELESRGELFGQGKVSVA